MMMFILVMDNGDIVEQGSHKELLKKNYDYTNETILNYIKKQKEGDSIGI